MKVYKGFNKDMTCRGFQFEEGKTYEEPEASLCNRGFHAVERPLDVLSYYAPASSVYRECELEGVSTGRNEDTKVCGTKIAVGAEIGIPGLVRAHIEYVKAHCTNRNNTEPGKPATAGYCGAATAGYGGAATAGDRGAATAGDRGAATAGRYGAAISRGSASVEDSGAAIARGNRVKAKGGMGAILVLVEENDNDYGIRNWCAGVVDGENIKPDTWYTCVSGRFVPVNDEKEAN